MSKVQRLALCFLALILINTPLVDTLANICNLDNLSIISIVIILIMLIILWLAAIIWFFIEWHDSFN